MKTYKKVFIIIIGVILLLSVFSIFSTEDVKLGNGYIYYDSHKMISSADGLYGEIPSIITTYNYDKNFIIAIQKPLENDPNALLYDFDYKYKDGYNNVYYWIIIKEKKKVIGPINKSAYVKDRVRYNIPNKLTLK